MPEWYMTLINYLVLIVGGATLFLALLAGLGFTLMWALGKLLKQLRVWHLLWGFSRAWHADREHAWEKATAVDKLRQRLESYEADSLRTIRDGSVAHFAVRCQQQGLIKHRDDCHPEDGVMSCAACNLKEAIEKRGITDEEKRFSEHEDSRA